jgi:predicted outer membrane repeat protein
MKAITISMLLLWSTWSYAAIRYVALGGTGAGTSWADAQGDLQAMLTASVAGDAVRVAAGTYLPNQDPFGNPTPTDPRTKTFFIPQGVLLYGGYDASTGIRNIGSNVTILSGDIDPIGDNDSYHVVLASNNTLGVTIDGFTIAFGKATGNATSLIQGNAIDQNRGAGLFLCNGSNTVRNNTILNHLTRDGGYGAGVYAHLGTTLFEKNRVSNNQATFGSGFYGWRGDNTFLNNTFTNHLGFVNAYGGGVYVLGGRNRFHQNTFSNNTATYGGGLFADDAIEIQSQENTFSGNVAIAGGGCYQFRGATNSLFTSEKDLFSGNVANGGGGGGLRIQGGTIRIQNGTFSGNHSNSEGGGAILVSEGTVAILGNTILDNRANTYSGGGVFVRNGLVKVINNVFYSNAANNGGGGALYTDVSLPAVHHNTFFANACNNGGGAIYTQAGSSVIHNNLFWDNKNVQGNNDVLGADYATNFGTNLLNNNLLQLTANNYTTFHYSLGGGTGNLFAQNPLFVNEANVIGADGFHRTSDDGLRLQTNSPALNAGITGGFAPTTDILNANRDAFPDLGAYEGGICGLLTCDDDCDGVPNAQDVCAGGNDAIDQNQDGLADCRYFTGMNLLFSGWKCGNQKVLMCHQRHTLCVPANAVAAHLAHGDYIGSCEEARCCRAAKKVVLSAYGWEQRLQFNLFPNPSSDQIQIAFDPLPEQPIQIRIVNLLGVTVLQTSIENSQSISLNINALSMGVYQVRVSEQGAQEAIQQFVIQR